MDTKKYSDRDLMLRDLKVIVSRLSRLERLSNGHGLYAIALQSSVAIKCCEPLSKAVEASKISGLDDKKK